MALQKNMTISCVLITMEGLLIRSEDKQLDNCYIKIDDYKGDKTSINVTVGIYKDKTLTQKYNQKQYTFTPDISDLSKNFIKQGYEYLKTLDEYKDAVDLLDQGQTS
ncbi:MULTISPECIES: hypothetical protein [Clostridium]|uniref:Uncharacterized protein n=1 Tax=Clostridium lapidicellarium TaxID=3240931 RepID=A0ABV4DVQ8_9CLOT